MKLFERLACRLGHVVRIPDISVEGHDLETHVCGYPVNVSSERTTLSLSSEALATAFLLPAATADKRLIGNAIDAEWLDGSRRILATARSWWGWKPEPPSFKSQQSSTPPKPGVGLAFSLGVDSFYSCFFAKPEPNLLILAAGFDIPLEKPEILRRMQDSVATVAEATGKNWTMISTNLRSHRLFDKSSWDRTHGGALGFLGHLLERHIGTLLVSSSYHQDHLGPWGSHPELDPYWSSCRVRFSHVGMETQRSEKLRRVVHHPVAGPLVQHHLQVCWESPSASGNCGHCQKCVMTRINLHRDAPGFRLENMAYDVPLAEAIDALPPILNELSLNFRRELTGCPDPRVEQALRDLIRRSEAAILARCKTKSTVS
jgi:hypothetical protein